MHRRLDDDGRRLLLVNVPAMPGRAPSALGLLDVWAADGPLVPHGPGRRTSRAVVRGSRTA